MKYSEIQQELIEKYRIDICDGTKCSNDWSRTHAHKKQRRVCKWKQANSIESTFTLMHEIGHICHGVKGTRRAEEEYYATVWAIERCREYGLKVTKNIVKTYQNYIDYTKDRGVRRGGTGYGNLVLDWSGVFDGMIKKSKDFEVGCTIVDEAGALHKIFEIQPYWSGWKRFSTRVSKMGEPDGYYLVTKSGSHIDSKNCFVVEG